MLVLSDSQAPYCRFSGMNFNEGLNKGNDKGLTVTWGPLKKSLEMCRQNNCKRNH